MMPYRTPAVNDRHRLWQCKTCGKTDRKSRVVTHIWKHHIPFDMVPFSCFLCGFRCHTKQELVTHLTDYPRHREEAAKYGGKVDLVKVLHQAPTPYYVSENDMLLVQPEVPNQTLPNWLCDVSADNPRHPMHYWLLNLQLMCRGRCPSAQWLHRHQGHMLRFLAG